MRELVAEEGNAALKPVSYTHLDVYKRQGLLGALYQIALNKVDAGDPKRRRRLRVFHRLPDHLQAQPMCTLNGCSHFILHGLR